MSNAKRAAGADIPTVFQIRAPNSLIERVRKRAVVERRSLNSQIVVMLEKALPPENEKAEATAIAPAE